MDNSLQLTQLDYKGRKLQLYFITNQPKRVYQIIATLNQTSLHAELIKHELHQGNMTGILQLTEEQR